MPIYTYSCQSCGVQFDKMQKFSDKPLSRCPECRTGHVRRILQPPAIVFKGSGWYSTDHRSPSGQSSSSSGSKAKSSEKKSASESSKSSSDE